MNPYNEVNQRVDIIALYHSTGNEQLTCEPKKMLYQGREIVFTKLGMRHPTEKGKRMIHAFNMSDDANDYRIEFDAERLTWTLVYVMEGHHV